MGLTLIELVMYCALTKVLLTDSSDSCVVPYLLVFLILCRVLYEFSKLYNR
jgi:hypothetical protein